jgi:polysaccharide export outer membrane protein
VKVPLLVRAVVFIGIATVAYAQDAPRQAPPPGSPEQEADAPVTGIISGVSLPDYRIGPGDALSVVFWRDRDMSADVVVRPDGRITLPVLNEVDVVGLTTEELREKITTLGRKYVTDPRVSIVVRQIKSRYVFITGKINRPGPYALYGPTTVLQLIAMAGGLRDYADANNIVVIRNDGKGKQVSHRFDYKRVAKGGDLEQNLTLQPGDTVVVP